MTEDNDFVLELKKWALSFGYFLVKKSNFIKIVTASVIVDDRSPTPYIKGALVNELANKIIDEVWDKCLMVEEIPNELLTKYTLKITLISEIQL